jgi:nitroreductase
MAQFGTTIPPIEEHVMNAAPAVSAIDVSTFDAINQRRSVRSYLPAVIDEIGMQNLLHAAVRAPTAIHEELWGFAVLQDAAALQRLSDRAKAGIAAAAEHHPADHGGHLAETFLRPEFNIFYDAGTLIAICTRPLSEFSVADCWLAAENLMLAAQAMGLGTCVIGSAVAALNTPEGKAELGVPADYAVVAPIIVGVPRGLGAPTVRKAPHVLAWKR